MSYSIAEAARRSGLSIDTLRYYERIKLLEPPARDTAGRRAYSDADLTWLEFLTKLRTTGMPIKSMREYASLRHRGTASAGRRKALLVEQRQAVASRIAELQSCMEILNYKIDNYDQIERKHRDVLAIEPVVEGLSA
ncbi:MerR family transcriptional regulator [Amycolatopsis sp. cg5]|uniref:MerR family transcriptional regulator n=1 Tax=Amycolatopsis sp. cg5 TaxID=3238802 RepID=UPI003525A07C